MSGVFSSRRRGAAWRRLIAAVAFALCSGEASAVDLTIATGPQTGVYWAMSQDLAAKAADGGLALSSKESPGSIANLYALRHTPGVQLALVQSDVLDFVKRSRDGASAEDAAQIDAILDAARLISVMHGEEVHLLTRREITSVSDLAGKRVAVGAAGSGATITGERLFDLLDVDVEFVRDIDAVTSLEYLRFGEVDAFLMVVGQPAPLFKQGVAPHENIHLLPLDDSRLLARYQPALIDPDGYDWLTDPVQTVSVRALLLGFPYSDPGVCAAISALRDVVEGQIGSLRTAGHPEWEDVDPTITTSAAPPHPCLAAAAADVAPAPLTTPVSTPSTPSDDGPDDAGLLNDLMR